VYGIQLWIHHWQINTNVAKVKTDWVFSFLFLIKTTMLFTEGAGEQLLSKKIRTLSVFEWNG